MGELVRLAREALKQQKGLDPFVAGEVRDSTSAIQPGSLVSWVRADGTREVGFVDFIHTDQAGKQWAFVSFGKTWAAVDRKLLTVVMP